MATIVIAEQDSSVREFLRALLEWDGHDCRCPSSLELGIDADLLLIDPDWALACEYGRRAREESAEIPIILSSHIVSPGTNLEALRPFRCLPRPFALAQVRQAVAEALEPTAARLVALPLHPLRAW